MNINGYSGYSNSLFNPYNFAPNSQTVGGVQNDAVALNRETAQIELKSPSSSIGNDFRVNISQEAQETVQQTSQNSIQATDSITETEPLAVNVNTITAQTAESDQTQQVEQTTETLRTERTDQNQQLQKIQQERQAQSQSSQYSYGQMALSRTSIDLMV